MLKTEWQAKAKLQDFRFTQISQWTTEMGILDDGVVQLQSNPLVRITYAAGCKSIPVLQIKMPK